MPTHLPSRESTKVQLLIQCGRFDASLSSSTNKLRMPQKSIKSSNEKVIARSNMVSGISWKVLEVLGPDVAEDRD